VLEQSVAATRVASKADESRNNFMIKLLCSVTKW
jgi:hypothetical protein